MPERTGLSEAPLLDIRLSEAGNPCRSVHVPGGTSEVSVWICGPEVTEVNLSWSWWVKGQGWSSTVPVKTYPVQKGGIDSNAMELGTARAAEVPDLPDDYTGLVLIQALGMVTRPQDGRVINAASEPVMVVIDEA